MIMQIHQVLKAEEKVKKEEKELKKKIDKVL